MMNEQQQRNPSTFSWIRTLELGYELTGAMAGSSAAAVPPSDPASASSVTHSLNDTDTKTSRRKVPSPLFGEGRYCFRCFQCITANNNNQNGAVPPNPENGNGSQQKNNQESTSTHSTAAAAAATTTGKEVDAKTDEGEIKQQQQQPLLPLLRCGKCRVATYCSRDCQVKDWKQQHKSCCESFRRVGPYMDFTTTSNPAVQTAATASASNDADVDVETAAQKIQHQEQAREDIFQRIRLYAGAYAVHQACQLGPGFLFVQSPQTLAWLSLTQIPPPFPLVTGDVQSTTRTTSTSSRSVLLHYLTLGEFDAEVCRDDFELASIRTELQTAVNKEQQEQSSSSSSSSCLVVLMRFRCGHVALGTTKLLPDWIVCRKLGMDYFGTAAAPPSLQLNLDDV